MFLRQGENPISDILLRLLWTEDTNKICEATRVYTLRGCYIGDSYGIQAYAFNISVKRFGSRKVGVSQFLFFEYKGN